jgi:hypothetical protein
VPQQFKRTQFDPHSLARDVFLNLTRFLMLEVSPILGYKLPEECKMIFEFLMKVQFPHFIGTQNSQLTKARALMLYFYLLKMSISELTPGSYLGRSETQLQEYTSDVRSFDHLCWDFSGKAPR